MTEKSTSYLEALNEKRLKAYHAMTEVLDRAGEEKRELTAEEEQLFQRTNAEMDSLDEEIRSKLDALDRAKRIEEERSEYEALITPVEARAAEEIGVPDTEEAQFRAFLSGETREFVAKRDYVAREHRDLSTGSTGAPVPTNFFNRVIEAMVAVGPMLETSTILFSNSQADLQIPRMTADSSASLVSEAGTIGESDPTFGAFITLDSYKLAYITQVTHELLADSSIDLIGLLAGNSGRALGRKLNSLATVGTGSSQNNGIVTASTAGVTGGTGVSGAFTAANLIDLFYSVDYSYRGTTAGWMMRDASIGAVRKLRADAVSAADGAGQFLFQPGMTARTADQLLGYPIWSNPDVVATATSAKSVIFGDLSRYYIRHGDFRFDRSDDFAFNTDLITFRSMVRQDSDLVDQSGAVKHFVGGAS